METGASEPERAYPALSDKPIASQTLSAILTGNGVRTRTLDIPVTSTRTPQQTPTPTGQVTFTPAPLTATATPGQTRTPVGTPDPTATGVPTETSMIPLMDLGTGTYKGFEGGLYPGGSNSMPEAHVVEGLLRAQAIRPRDPSGATDRDGKYIFLSIGMSNTSLEFCGGLPGNSCKWWSFIHQAAIDPLVNHDQLVILNGARGGAVTVTWDDPDDINYDLVRDEVLAPSGYTEHQVQIVWVKIANAHPSISLPGESSDAFGTYAALGDVLRALHIRYPNLQQVFISSRIYAGYATTTLNPEPYAYEYGFSVKWVIEAQIDQMAGSGIDPVPGDLNYNTVAPWAAWGPYLWADGATPRSDGLIWLPQNFYPDGTHPTNSGVKKVADLLLDFFSTSPLTSCWFLADGVCEVSLPNTGLFDAEWWVFPAILYEPAWPIQR